MRETRNLIARLGVALWMCSPAAADETATADHLLDFISNGCINSLVIGEPLKAFAIQIGAALADANISAPILGKDVGEVFVKSEPFPIAIAARSGGACSVNASLPESPVLVIAAVDDFLAGPGGDFHLARVFEEQADLGRWTTHRVYVGRRRGIRLTLLFSATPDLKTIDQIFFAATETKP